MALKDNMISFWKRVRAQASDMFTLFKVGVGVKVPTNKLHVKDASDPMKLEGVQTDTSSSTKYLVLDSDNVIKHATASAGSARTVTAGGNTLASSESLDFVAGSNVTISESGGDVTIASSDTTYSISCVDGDNSDEEKIRLTAGGSGSGTDDIVLEAGTGLSISRSSDKITFTNTVSDTNTFRNVTAGGNTLGSSESLDFLEGSNITISESGGDITISSTDTNTQLSTEEVQDIVGAMFTSNTETRISATYQDGDGTIDLVVDAIPVDLTVDGAGTIHANNVPTLNQNTSGTAADLSATLGVDKGGTGATTLTSTGILLGNGTSAIQASSNIKVTNDVLTIKNEESDGPGGIKFLEAADNGSHGTTLSSNSSLAGDRAVVLPNSSGTLALQNESTTGNAATATALQTARNIGGVSFDGTGNINLPGVNTAGNQNTSGNAATATTANALASGTSTGDTFTFTSANANDPLFVIKNTTDDTNGPILKLFNDKASDGVDDDEAGIIQFAAKDDGTPTENIYATINGIAADVTAGAEEGRLDFKLSNGSGGYLTALKLDGDGSHTFSGTVTATGFTGPLTGNASGLSSTLGVDKGGTGSTTFNSGHILRGNGTSALNADSNLSFNNSIFSVQSSTSAKPVININNTNTDAEAPELILVKGTTGADGDDLGKIKFDGFDAGDNSQTFSQILGEIAEADDGSEEGKLTLSVASHDGELQPGLIIASGNAEDEVDVTIGNGATSLTTTAGDLTVTGTLTGKVKYQIAGSEQAAGTSAGGDVIFVGSTTLAAGKIYYLNSSSEWILADAAAESTAKGLLGVALGDATGTAAGVLLRGIVTLSTHAGSAVGVPIYLNKDTNKGTATATPPSGSGDIVRSLGYNVRHDSSRCEVYFNPDNTYIEV